MNQIPISSIVVALLVVLALAFGVVQTVRLWWGPFDRRRKQKQRQRRAVSGEIQAAGLLRDQGYELLGVQVTTHYGIWVDGTEQLIELRADYLVRRDGRTFVAEVKTGKEAPHLHSAATRRQLLEYRIAFAVDGVILVDAESGRIRQVEFPFPERKVAGGVSGWWWLAVGIVMGAVGAWVVLAGMAR